MPVGTKPAVLTVALPAVTLSSVAGVAFMYAAGTQQPQWWKGSDQQTLGQPSKGRHDWWDRLGWVAPLQSVQLPADTAQSQEK